MREERHLLLPLIYQRVAIAAYRGRELADAMTKVVWSLPMMMMMIVGNGGFAVRPTNVLNYQLDDER